MDGRAFLEFAQLTARGAHHWGRDAGQSGNLDTVALVGWAILDRVEEDNAFAVLDGIKVHIGEIGVLGGQSREFDLVCGKQGQRPVFLDEVAADGKGQRHAVEG